MTAQQIFSCIEPYRIVADLKIPVVSEDGQFLIVNPKGRQGRFVLHEDGVLEVGPELNFVAGSSVDFLAFIFGGNYREAVDYLLRTYDDLLRKENVGLIFRKDNMASELSANHVRFLALYGCRRNLTLDGKNLGLVINWLRNRQIDPRYITNLVYGMRGCQLNDLLDISKFKPSGQYAVFPYFENYYTYAMLRVVNVEKDTTEDLKLSEAGHIYFGLHTCKNFRRTALVFQDHLSATKTYVSEYGLRPTDTRGCVSIINNTDQPENSFMLPDLTFTSPDHDVSSILALRRAGKSTYVQTRIPGGLLTSPRVTLKDHIIETFINYYGDDNWTMTPRILALASAIRHDHDLFTGLLGYIDKAKLTNVRDQLITMLDVGHKYSFKGMTILETPYGYVATRKGTVQESHFTNFIFRLEHTLAFEDSSDSYLVGRLICNGKECPMVLPRSSTNRPLEIEQSARTALRHRFPDDKSFPAIHDMSMKSSLAYVINSQIKPNNVTGVDVLGWTRGNRRFVTPTWKCNALGVTSTSRTPNPSDAALERCFDFSVLKLAGAPATVSPPVWTVLSIVASWVVRAYTGSPTPPVKVLQTAKNWTLLKTVMRVLGQTEEISLNLNVRGGKAVPPPASLHGYPIYTTCVNEEVYDLLNYPAFGFCTKGINFDCSIPDSEVEGLQAFIYKTISDMVVNLMREGTRTLTFSPVGSNPTHQLIREGRDLIQRFTQHKNVPVLFTSTPLFSQFLSGIAPDDVVRYFHLEPEEECIVLDIRNVRPFLDSANRSDLLEELKTLAPEAGNRGCHSLSLPVAMTQSFINSFYGQEIPIGPYVAGDTA